MKTIMWCCVTLHNMVFDELQPIDEDVPENCETVTVGENVDYCFERVGGAYPMQHGTIATVSGWCRSLQSVRIHAHKISSYGTCPRQWVNLVSRCFFLWVWTSALARIKGFSHINERYFLAFSLLLSIFQVNRLIAWLTCKILLERLCASTASAAYFNLFLAKSSRESMASNLRRPEGQAGFSFSLNPVLTTSYE